MPADRPTLAVIPVHLRREEELEAAVRCAVSLWSTTDAQDTIALVVDDGSPEPALSEQLALALGELGYLLHAFPEPGGFARAANVGLARALEAEADAVLVEPDLELTRTGWLDVLRGRTDARGRPAAVVGARLLYPDDLVEHAGLAFSLLQRRFVPRLRFAPAGLPEALLPTRCPVARTLQLIRHETLAQIGLYDEAFRHGFEDVDYCLRAFAAGLECVYEPAAVARRHVPHVGRRLTEDETATSEASEQHLMRKWAGTDMREWIAEVL